MVEDIIVEARFEKDGSIRPMAFIWGGKRFLIASLGRQWEQNDERHFLVMTPTERVYEIAYSSLKGIWRLLRSPEDFGGSRRAV